MADSSFAIRNAAASAISAIARIEIPCGMWNGIFDSFRDAVQDPNQSIEYKVACVESIRYICEDLQDVQEYIFSDEMVGTLFLILLGCIQSNQPDPLWKEAVMALNQALPYADEFMKDSNQCRCVMEGVYNSTQHGNDEIQSCAFECLDSIFYLFYSYVTPYFEAFYNACEKAICGNLPETAIQACLTLVTLANVEKEYMDSNTATDELCKKCGGQLVPYLCQIMTTKDEDDDSETMTLPTATATCLRAFAEVMKNGRRLDLLLFYRYCRHRLAFCEW